VAVFGCGGVGLNVIQGARIAGAERVIAIDTLPAKLDMAKQFGATDTLLAKPGDDVSKTLKKLTAGGPDYAFECVGNGELAAAAYRAIRRGGLAVVVGVAKPGDSTSVRTMTLPFEEKTLTGELLRLVHSAHRFPAHARPLHGRPAQARRADHATLFDRRGAAGVRRPGIGPQRARRDRLLRRAP
jgi:S-(hydroxymethyl)glutathione dehydrogenase/alcohol dehydrogenase